MLAGILLAFSALLAINVGRIRERLWPHQAQAAIHSIAVLPLENLSSDPAQEYFAEGMTDELITEIARIHSLRVISRTSVSQYRNPRASLPAIAWKLGVEAVLEGAVLRTNQKVRITARLIRASDDRLLWAEEYERDLKDVIALQAEVAQTIANHIQLKLTPQEHASLEAFRPTDPQAYEAYLEGDYFRNKAGEANLEKSITLFQKAITDRARQLDPISTSSYTVLGMVLYRAGRYDEAIKACRRAVELDPNHPTALWFMALAHEQKGDLPQAIAELKQAESMSRAPLYRALLAHAYGLAGDRRKALQLFRDLQAESRARYISPVDIALIYTGLRDRDAAFAWLQKAYQERAMRIQELTDPEFRNLRGDPRFTSLVQRVGLPVN